MELLCSFFISEATPARVPVISPFAKGKRAFLIFFAQHGYIEGIERHWNPFGQYKSMFRPQTAVWWMG